MAIVAEERMRNVKLSLFNHIDQNYTATAKQFQGSNVIDTSSIDEWVWFGVMGTAAGRFFRQVRENRLGGLVTVLLNCTIKLKPTIYFIRMDEIRDLLVNILRRPSIAVVDHTGNGATIGRLIGDGLVDDARMGVVDDLDQAVLSFHFHFLEEYTA